MYASMIKYYWTLLLWILLYACYEITFETLYNVVNYLEHIEIQKIKHSKNHFLFISHL